MPKENFRAYLAWVAICLIWGTTYLAIRIGVHDFPPVLFAGFRWLMAGPILIIILKLRRYKLPTLKDIKHLAVVGILLLGFGNGLVVFAEQWVPSGLTALLISTDPLWIVGIESLLQNGPRLNLKIVVGVLLGLAGVILIFGSNLSAILNTQYLVGILGLMFCIFCWSSGTLYSKYKKVSVHPLMGAAVQMTIAGIGLSLLGVIIGESSYLHLTQNGVLSFFYLLVFGSFIAYGSYMYAVANLPVSFVSTYAYVNPIIALFLGWLILDEKLDYTIMIGAIIILIGVYTVKKGSDARTKMKGVELD
jgi:drug/metabolite transporter (DMT)-like permease